MEPLHHDHEASTCRTRHILTAPRGANTEGCLVIRPGLGNAALRGDANIAELYTAHCTGRAPRARCAGGTVELIYPRLSLASRMPPDTVTLNASIPWRIDVVGGVGYVRADLRCVRVRSIDVEGGTARTIFDLARPDGTMPIRFGAVSQTVILRPAGVPVRVRLRRGARRLTVDDHCLDAVNWPTTLATPGYDGSVHRIAISLDVADGLTVTTSPTPAADGDVLLATPGWLTRRGWHTSHRRLSMSRRDAS